MNNIDILEELLSTQKQYIEDKDYQKEHNINEEAIDYARRWAKAIETLIAENKELKEENKCLKNKELDYMTVYLNGVYDGEKKVKDKIKAKIEEINKEMLNEENSLELFYRKKYCKEILQELLDERNNTDEG